MGRSASTSRSRATARPSSSPSDYSPIRASTSHGPWPRPTREAAPDWPSPSPLPTNDTISRDLCAALPVDLRRRDTPAAKPVEPRDEVGPLLAVHCERLGQLTGHPVAIGQEFLDHQR